MIYPTLAIGGIALATRQGDRLLYVSTLDRVTAARAPGETVVLDPRLSDVKVLDVKNLDGGKASINFAWLLTVSGIPIETSQDQAGPQALVGRLVVPRRNTADQLADQVTLRPLDGARLDRRDRPNFRAYRVEGR